LLAYSAVRCDQAPIIRIDGAEDAIRIEITPRLADPDADCEAMPIGWVVELRLRDPLGARSIEISEVSR
jgi:hypothetical protein